MFILSLKYSLFWTCFSKFYQQNLYQKNIWGSPICFLRLSNFLINWMKYSYRPKLLFGLKNILRGRYLGEGGEFCVSLPPSTNRNPGLKSVFAHTNPAKEPSEILDNAYKSTLAKSGGNFQDFGPFLQNIFVICYVWNLNPHKSCVFQQKSTCVEPGKYFQDKIIKNMS